MTGPRVLRIEVRSARVLRVQPPVPTRILRVGASSAPGIPGDGTVSYMATLAEAAGMYSAVVSFPDGLYVADPLNLAHAGRLNGVLAQGGVAGARVRVVLTGPIPGWSGAQGRMWCGVAGQPTASPPPGHLWRQIIAFSPEPGSFIVQLKPVLIAAQ